VEAEAWIYVGIVSIAARQDADTSPVHAPDQLEFLGKLAVSVRPILSAPLLAGVIAHLLPKIAHVARNVFQPLLVHENAIVEMFIGSIHA